MQLNKFFLKSPYFNQTIILFAAGIAGLLVALFPFTDVSLHRLMNIAVLSVFLLTTAIAYLIIVYVVFVTFVLDKKHDWDDQKSKRLVYQILYGGIFPLLFIVGYQSIFYGTALFWATDYYYIFALQMMMLYLLNERAYVIYLADRSKAMKAKISWYHKEYLGMQNSYEVLNEKYNLQATKIEELSNRRMLDEVTLNDYRQEILTLRAQCAEQEIMLENARQSADKERFYTVQIGNMEKVFREETIAAFEAIGQKNKKPLIYLWSTEGDKLLTKEDSLKKIQTYLFPHFIRLTRQHLVPAH